MYKTLINLIACFIPNKKKRTQFRNKYKIKRKVTSIGNNIIKIPSNKNTIIIDDNIDYQSIIHIKVFGDNNHILIKNCNARISLLMGTDDGRAIHNSSFEFGESYSGNTNYIMMEDNTHIKIGDNCMFSTGIMFRCTDDHAIIDIRTKNVINKANSIEIGDHVWLGMNSTVLKNSKVANGCVVGLNTVVAGKFEKENCVLVGNPARIVRENIEWDGARPDLY